ncbi:HlyD family efflux transporter periplasmic adaptor subunit [Luteibacter sp. dw_328]|uniref:HlyD family efflux transporter periplasmic adaptor subunit n=1 Tax=Luteibacter sp. dw_328 TaxID=2719796 RepID=UPI001BD48DC8|nr:HlyD family efflux transporter periplasmic adaptor subunit [Luteibacter sp. dw_328]
MTAPSRRAGIVATAIAVVLAVLFFTLVLLRIDAQPRTHVAYLYADTTALAPDVGGRIVAIHTHDNQAVHAGDLLIEIDPEPYELHLRQAHAQVAALEAQVSLAGRQVTSQNSGAQAAQTNVVRARTQLKLADETLARLQPMVAPGYVTQQKLDEAIANQRSAAAALDAASSQADQARQGVSDTHTLEAQLEGSRASLLLAERDLRMTRLVAPFDGVVTGLQIAEGTYAVAGHPLFTLVDARRWYAVADFRETDLSGMAVGDRASVWLLGDTARSVPGHVESLSPGVQGEVGGGPGLPTVERSLKWVVIAQRFPVRILLDNPPPALMRIGATVTVVVRGPHVR